MSADNPQKVKAEGYIVLVPDIYRSTNPRYDSVRSIRIDRVRAGKPSLESGEIAFKLRLHFSESAILSSILVIDLDVSSFVTAPVEPELAEVGA